MFNQSQRAEIVAKANELQIDPHALMAVVKVESAGKIFANVEGNQLPLIRWEGHYFDRLIKASKRDEARRLGLANPRAGKVKNPRKQASRWALLDRAMKLDPDAARMSISIGIGQVMVSHWQWLGYNSPSHMIEVATRGFRGQLDTMLRYIRKADLVDELQRLDWSGFARGYNGPAYRKWGYHTKMKNAFASFGGRSSNAPISSNTGMLRMGSQGSRVRELQTMLVKHGHAINIDGDFGPATRDAVRRFQIENDLIADGIAGPLTWEAVLNYENSQDPDKSQTPASDNPDVKTGVVGMGGGAALTVGGDKINDVAEKLSGSGLGVAEYAALGLFAVAGVLFVAGAFWAIRGHFKSKQTYEGV